MDHGLEGLAEGLAERVAQNSQRIHELTRENEVIRPWVTKLRMGVTTTEQVRVELARYGVV